MNKTYSELVKLSTFEDRFNYLKLDGVVGKETFGFDRYFNQQFYRSYEWKAVRDFVIIRDNGFDLGMEGYPIGGRILIHHINPICCDDILKRSSILMDPENLICVSHKTHNAIHYGNEDLLAKTPCERTANDTCPWKH